MLSFNKEFYHILTKKKSCVCNYFWYFLIIFYFQKILIGLIEKPVSRESWSGPALIGGQEKNPGPVLPFEILRLMNNDVLPV